jgi:hypothetical protein
MEVTGQNFDMDPKTFTLGNMFSMQLHKYAEEIGKITNAAVKVSTAPCGLQSAGIKQTNTGVCSLPWHKFGHWSTCCCACSMLQQSIQPTVHASMHCRAQRRQFHSARNLLPAMIVYAMHVTDQYATASCHVACRS